MEARKLPALPPACKSHHRAGVETVIDLVRIAVEKGYALSYRVINMNSIQNGIDSELCAVPKLIWMITPSTVSAGKTRKRASIALVYRESP